MELSGHFFYIDYVQCGIMNRNRVPHDIRARDVIEPLISLELNGPIFPACNFTILHCNFSGDAHPSICAPLTRSLICLLIHSENCYYFLLR